MNRTLPRRDVGKAAGVIEKPSARRHGKRVHGKIPAQGIDPEIAAEADLRVTAVGLDVLAQSRDFEGFLLPRARSRCHVEARSEWREGQRLWPAP